MKPPGKPGIAIYFSTHTAKKDPCGQGVVQLVGFHFVGGGGGGPDDHEHLFKQKVEATTSSLHCSLPPNEKKAKKT